ncbi:methionyl-tRNA formyltransferase [Candidatus Nomurabacteria bacterium]|nr:methionyl-tRNA formyltransferase [Candidatus Nomurabacteria bacterium]
MQKENNKLNFVFFGTPDVASETLEILKQNGYLPSLIITSPDKPQGRKMIVTPPPVKTWAIENNIPYIQPDKITKEEININEQNIQFFLVVAYGKILPEEIINMPKLGSINIHYSLLPKYRGASPVESAILNEENETGVSIQKMVYKMDAGDILAQEKTEIYPDENAPKLRKRLIEIGSKLLVKILPDFIDEKIKSEKQDENLVTHCKKIKKEDGLVDLESESSNILYNKFRAYYGWPRIFFFKENKRMIITDASLIDNNFVIKSILPEGKKEIDYSIYKKTNLLKY